MSNTPRFIVSPDSVATGTVKQSSGTNNQDTIQGEVLTLPEALDVLQSQGPVISEEGHNGGQPFQCFHVEVEHFAIHTLAQTDFKNLA